MEVLMRDIDALRARRYAIAVEEADEDEREQDDEDDDDGICWECHRVDRHDTACSQWVCGHGSTGCPYCTTNPPADEGPDGE
jgi:hypothetical protein